MSDAPDDAPRKSLADDLFRLDRRRITPWLTAAWLLLTVLGAAGLIQAYLAGDRAKLQISGAFFLFITAFSALFLYYLRGRRRWYLEVENERLNAQALSRDAANSEFVCSVCHRYEASGTTPCSMCGRPACRACLREAEGEDEFLGRRYCPTCWEAGEPFRDAMLRLEIACDSQKAVLEREWKESAARLLGRGRPADAEKARRLREFDATIGLNFREKIVNLDLELEREKERLHEEWTQKALTLLKRRRPESRDDKAHRRGLDVDDEA